MESPGALRSPGRDQAFSRGSFTAERLAERFPEICRFIDAAVNDHGVVYVHCGAGGQVQQCGLRSGAKVCFFG